MKESSGEEHQASIYDKSTMLAPGKVGKTCFLVGSLLGVLPNQLKNGTGGAVDRPSHLHVIAIDSSAMAEVIDFLKSCGAPDEISKIRIYNMSDDVNRLASGDDAYDLRFYNSYVATVMRIRNLVAQQGGTHALLVSSLTALSAAIERSVAGPPGAAGVTTRTGELSGKGYMDMSKWQVHAQQLNQIRMITQVDDFHCIWEGHIDRVKKGGQGEGVVEEVVAISGKTGRNWGYNTDHIFRLERNFGDQWDGTSCDKVALNTKPEMEFFPGGRGYTGKLKRNEYDLVKVYRKLGLKVGGWGRKKESKVRED